MAQKGEIEVGSPEYWLERAGDAAFRWGRDQWQLFDRSPLPMWVHDPESLRFLAANEAAIRQYGYSAEDFLGMTLRDLHVPGDTIPPAETLRALPSDAPSRARWRQLKKDGSVVQVDLTVIPFMHADKPARLGIVDDPAIHREAQRTLLETQRLLAETQRATGVGSWQYDTGTDRFAFSGEARRILGLEGDAADLGLTGYLALAWRSDRKRVAAAFADAIAGNAMLDLEHRVEIRDAGEPLTPRPPLRVIQLRGQLIRDHENVTSRLVGALVDITALAAAEDAGRRHALVFDNLSEAVVTYDFYGKVTEWNLAAERMFGYSAREAIGQSIGLFRPPEVRDKLVREITETTQSGRPYEAETPFQTKSGARGLCESRVNMLTDREGRVIAYVGVYRDITERKRHEQALRYAATHDTLTGLPNRGYLNDLLDGAIAEAMVRDESAALVLADLTRFGELNDTLGYRAGDVLLHTVARRLAARLSPGDALARVGGDKFAIVLANLRSRAEFHPRITPFLEAFQQPFEVMHLALKIETNMGVALAPEHGDEAGHLLRCADVALHLAKGGRGGPAPLVFYSPDRDEFTSERLALANDLHVAMTAEQFMLHYQPKITLPTRRISGYEALARWWHPRQGLLMPGRFMHLVEMGALIDPFTRWVVREALLQLSNWSARGVETRIAVNVSARNLVDDAFPDTIAESLEAFGVAGERLEIEITESVLMSEPDRAIASLKRIAELGVQLAIDDFGTGYASLAYLQRLPAQKLKIDQSFTRSLESPTPNLTILRTIIGLAHNLGLSVIAEGVEGERSLEILADLGCDEAQGFHVGRPRSAMEMRL